jgi:hypothetical protein
MNHSYRFLNLSLLLLTSICALQNCKTGGDSSDDPGPSTTTPAVTPVTTAPVTTSPAAPTPPVTPAGTFDKSASQTSSLTACLNAWQKGAITGAPATVGNYSAVRVIDATAQVTATDPAPPSSGAPALLVLLKLGTSTTTVQVYGSNTWYCIDNSAVPKTVDVSVQLCSSGHAADGSPGTGAKSLKFSKNKNC